MNQKSTFTPKRAIYAVVVTLLAASAVFAASDLSITPVKAAVQSDDASVPEALSSAFAKVADMVSPAVAFVEVEKELAGDSRQAFSPFDQLPDGLFERFFGERMPRGQQRSRHPISKGQGTGFIISSDGYIVTNHHVVGDADEIRVKLADGRSFEAKVVGSDPKTEIALIKIDGKNLPTVALGDSDTLKVGEWVIAIGNPFGLSHSVTAGIVSAKGRGGLQIADYSDFIQTDAAINPGNSGGPLLNLKGEVVGLNTAIFTRSGGYMGIGFAIPVNMVRFVEEQLRENGHISRGFLGIGIQNLKSDMAQFFHVKDPKGVLISQVTPGSPAEKAGLVRDDIVVEFDGRPVTEIGSFHSRVASTPPGAEIEIAVMRNGKRITKTIEIGTLESDNVVASNPGARSRNLGLSVQNLTAPLAERFGFQGKTGVLISQVEPDSAASEAGIRPGMLIEEVNREPVRNTADFHAAVGRGESDQTLLLLITDGEMARYATLRIHR